MQKTIKTKTLSFSPLSFRSFCTTLNNPSDLVSRPYIAGGTPEIFKLKFFLLYNVYHIRFLKSCSYSNLQTTYTLYADNITYFNNGLLPLTAAIKKKFRKFCFVKYKFHVAEF